MSQGRLELVPREAKPDLSMCFKDQSAQAEILYRTIKQKQAIKPARISKKSDIDLYCVMQRVKQQGRGF